MNKKFIKSVAAGVLGLTLAASCGHMPWKKDSGNCGAKNGCAGKKKECNKCSTNKKGECNKCSGNKCSGKKAPAKE
jgi:hypothetical protein